MPRSPGRSESVLMPLTGTVMRIWGAGLVVAARSTLRLLAALSRFLLRPTQRG